MMKTKTSILAAIAVTSLALLVIPAQAGGHRNHHYNNNCGGSYYYGSNHGYYQPRVSCRPIQYYRPVIYRPAPVFFFPRPFFQIGFGFGGNNGYCRY
jgi:hypothetical protein